MNLTEAHQTIEMQRKSLLDLQLQNEGLSQNLLEEKAKMEVVTKRYDLECWVIF